MNTRDTRSTEIKAILKTAYPNSTFRVRIQKYSMGESINLNTDLIQREQIADSTSYTGFSSRLTDQSKQNRDNIQKLLSGYESIDRDEMGEILSGGNTFLFIEEM